MNLLEATLKTLNEGTKIKANLGNMDTVIELTGNTSQTRYGNTLYEYRVTAKGTRGRIGLAKICDLRGLKLVPTTAKVH